MFFDPVRRKTVAPRSELRRLPRAPIHREYLTDAEIIASVGDVYVMDIECYTNLFFVAFKHLKSGKFVVFEQSPRSAINWQKLRWLLWAIQFVTFNGDDYDVPLLSIALLGCVDCVALKGVSQEIIGQGKRPIDIEREWKIKIESYNHIDVQDVAPLSNSKSMTQRTSLKKYAARMHAPRLQELPYHHTTVLNEAQAIEVMDYCLVDCDNTELLLNELAPQIEMRVELSKKYGVDLRSKSDAQIAESIIVSEVTKITGRFPRKADVKIGHEFCYKPPSYISFETQAFHDMLIDVSEAIFVIDEGGSPRCPAMQAIEVRLGDNTYAMGLGGLHSREKSRALYATETHGLSDIDVASYYPRLILNLGIKPAAMGDAFPPVFESILQRRLIAKDEAKNAKKAGDKAGEKSWLVEADSLKITANGTFGKTGSQHSSMYVPEGMIGITLGGQLSILMLIERLYLRGFEVMSGNTDGILVRYERTRRSELEQIIKAWEATCGFQTEETPYRAMFNRDVNNYIAIKEDGEVKVKGVYSERGSSGNTRLSKNPEALILSDAVQAFLTVGTPIEQTINTCEDFRRFVIVREVKGGGECAGVYLGKVVRYMYAKGSRNTINYIESGNKVPNSDGCMPCMDLPSAMPINLDRERYIADAMQVLVDIGHTKPQGALF